MYNFLLIILFNSCASRSSFSSVFELVALLLSSPYQHFFFFYLSLSKSHPLFFLSSLGLCFSCSRHLLFNIPNISPSLFSFSFSSSLLLHVGTRCHDSFNPFPNMPWFLRVCRTCLMKTMWEKEKFLVTSNFSFSRIAFYSFGELSTIFMKFGIVGCKLFQFGRV